eukprot:gene9494-biopygen9200
MDITATTTSTAATATSITATTTSTTATTTSHSHLRRKRWVAAGARAECGVTVPRVGGRSAALLLSRRRGVKVSEGRSQVKGKRCQHAKKSKAALVTNMLPSYWTHQAKVNSDALTYYLPMVRMGMPSMGVGGVSVPFGSLAEPKSQGGRVREPTVAVGSFKLPKGAKGSQG